MIRSLRQLGSRSILTFLLFVVFAAALVSAGNPLAIGHAGGADALFEIVTAAFRPDLSPSFLKVVLMASLRTLAYAFAGMSIALLAGIPLGVLASGTLFRRSRRSVAASAVVRALLGGIRAIHELVWALLLVAALGLAPVAGAIAIGIAYAGIIGRIIAERLQDIPEPSLAALRSVGASETRVVLYGRLPAAMTDLISYFLYRTECAIRSSAVLSFVGLGGIGFRIGVALDDLRYEQVWTLIFALVGIVIAIDWWSSQLRRRLM